MPIAHQMTIDQMKDLLRRVAREFIERGPGYAQDTVVLREVAERLGGMDEPRHQQMLLTAWHDLFRDGVLSWGFDIDNPSPPFFHFADREVRSI